ncbi:putative membrane protein [Amycolatopsis bartoniae]|uniref:DUF1211 domain-containing membrane protein n=1 Tax=Amycolatopsis bartoniae TaxID=941986 RepID=A0A8H9ITL7_9PSEU|nr:TMEM175 family protein [Amycolatopsis bartoniae]MBB2936742.1 putative membrane protein [Amycolatopsis bartoniae]TVT09205.1 DUF1211 domain-containing protein [Amycolatopsis bartoniae]GHF49826.1 DUF1211 domain-containing membrane protein [Amycolatopsis bartoniae]
MDRPKTPERLVFFSDAVVAIALTLLVLPLADSVPELVAEHRPAVEVITGNGWQIGGFALSFVVIARQWVGHHRLFEQVKSYNSVLVWLNFAWLFTVAVVPLTSEVTGAYGRDRFTVLFYIGTILANTLCLSAMTILVHGNEKLAHDPSRISRRSLINSVGSVGVLVVAFVLAAFVPGVQYYVLLLLLVPPQVARLRRLSEA